MDSIRKTSKLILSIHHGYSHTTILRHVRCGYRLKPETVKDKDTKENFSDKVMDAVLHKKRSPYRGLDRYVPAKEVNPNEKFFNRFDLPQYGSLNRYIESAEQRREAQFKYQTPNTMAEAWSKYFDEPDFVNIGFKSKLLPKSAKYRSSILNKNMHDIELEKAARERTLALDVLELTEEWERSFNGIKDINNIAHHYGVFKDLFGHAHFYPCVQMNIDYIIKDNNMCNPVYYGNEISPEEAISPPEVTYECDDNKLWTLLLTNPDGNLENNEEEYVHWLIGNIPGNKIANGEVLVDYLPPIPVKGTGYHRLIFILFQQSEEINFSSEQRILPCLSLQQRNFLTKDFYRKYESKLFPASLRFFQTRWDTSVHKTYHETLDMVHPIYEFIPQDIGRIRAPLQKYPHNKPFEWLKSFMPEEPIYPGGGKFM